MPAWRLAIATATSPATPLDAARRFFVRQRAGFAALAALGVTLILGWAAPVPPPFGWVFGGLGGVLGLGLLAWHLARLTVMPLADPITAALAAALVAIALLPGLGPHALLAPAILSLWSVWRQNGQRVVALLVQCGAAAEWAATAVNQIGFTFVSETMLGIAAFLVLRGTCGAANDNPSMERIVTNSWLLANPCYAKDLASPESGSGE